MKLYSLTDKQKAVKNVRDLMAKGNSISKARALVGSIFRVTTNTIYNWERQLATATTRATTVHSNGTLHSPLITSVNIRTTKGVTVQLTPDDISNIAKLAGYIH